MEVHFYRRLGSQVSTKKNSKKVKCILLHSEVIHEVHMDVDLQSCGIFNLKSENHHVI